MLAPALPYNAPMSQHDDEISLNRSRWENKPLLRAVYAGFHRRIAAELSQQDGITAELGSGIGSIAATISGCVMTDLFDNPGIDQVEDAYHLSWGDSTLSNLILFDVFHHLRHPGTALAEFHRVLRPGGRLLLFEPCVSLLGRLVYGPLHPEPLGLGEAIEWQAPEGFDSGRADYYAAQGNASRIFLGDDYREQLSGWQLVRRERLSALSYIASGGFSGPQLYPAALLPVMQWVDRVADCLPALFATRLFVVLEAATTDAA